MGVFSHSTHLHLPDRDRARTVAAALLRSPHSLVLSPPSTVWLNLYLPQGLACKDIPELPTVTALELNCYDSEGLDIRLYAADRLAFMFESGCGDLGEEEDKLLETAQRIYEEKTGQTDFWSLAPEEQEKYVATARTSGEFRKYVQDSDENLAVPDVAPFEPLLPSGRSLADLRLLLASVSKRLHGSPTQEPELTTIKRWMGGMAHSPKAEDYIEAVARFFDIKGALWSLETIQGEMADKVDRRVIPLDAVCKRPAACYP